MKESGTRSSGLPEPIVRARALDGLLLERYDYEAGPGANIATHVHETYQIGLALAPAGTRLDQDVRIASLLSDLYRRGAGNSPALAAPVGVLARVREWLHDEPLADTSLAELASLAGLHPHHLVRAFGKRYGVPPHRYRRLLRIELAKQRLSRGDPLSDVALATGFYDQSHFGRHFRRVVGTTPGRYRPAGP